jgi:hypothetical protein
MHQPRADLLVLKPVRTRGVMYFFLASTGVGMVLLGRYIHLQTPNLFAWLVGGFGIIFVLSGAFSFLSQTRYEFDRQEGNLRTRSFVSQHSRPLSQIVAVQLIEGGWYGYQDGGRGPPFYFTYEMNLILNDSQQPRLNLTSHPDWHMTWRSANQLGKFLKVPVQDEVPEEEQYARL